MACRYPLRAFKLAGGGVTFTELARYDTVAELELPCGRCLMCRLERSRQWSVRMAHEAKLHEENSFVTLTYRPESLPAGGSLRPRDTELFLKRLRRRFSDKRVRYYLCGEYGERLGRPHYHACLFGLDFPDKIYCGKTSSGVDKFTSRVLDDVWGLGETTVQEFSIEAAAYAARYVVDKITGDEAEKHYERYDSETGEIFGLVPEFNRMSRRPGIGHDYVRLYWSDIVASGSVVVGGREVKPPRFYDEKLRKLSQWDEIEYRRWKTAVRFFADGTPERLAVREQVQRARLAFKKRHKEI